MMEKDKSQSELNKKIRRRNFISFTTLLVFSGAAYGGWKALYNAPTEVKGITGGTKVPLRRALNKSELFFRRIFSNNHLAKTYPKSAAAKNARVNGHIGMTDSFSIKDWRLLVKKDKQKQFVLTIDDIKALPKTEIVFDFKCVEGWDQVQHWAGVKFTDFVTHFSLQKLAEKAYVGLETPDGKYYVGLDRESAMHPQTILAYEMNGKPINGNHGAPLRLIVPTKYGIKNLKRIGLISFSDTRPRDYWAERGYDYYSGL